MDGYGCLDYDDTDSKNSDYSRSERVLYASKSDTRVQTCDLSSLSDDPENPCSSQNGMGDDRDISLLYGRFHYQSCRLKRNLKEMDIQQKHTQWVHERLHQLREEILEKRGNDPGSIPPLPFIFNYEGPRKEKAGGDSTGINIPYESLLKENAELKERWDELTSRKDFLESRLREIVDQAEANTRETQETIAKLKENVIKLQEAYGEERAKAEKYKQECTELQEKIEMLENRPDNSPELLAQIQKKDEDIVRLKSSFEETEKAWSEQTQKNENIVRILKKKFQEAKDAFFKVKMINSELDSKLRKIIARNKELDESIKKLEDNKRLTKEVIETLEESNKTQQETICTLRDELNQQDEKLKKCTCKELQIKMAEQQQLMDDIELRNKKLSEKCAVLKEEAHMMKDLIRNTKGGKNWIDRLIKFSSYKVK